MNLAASLLELAVCGLAVYGAWHLCRSVAAWGDGQLTALAWRRHTAGLAEVEPHAGDRWPDVPLPPPYQPQPPVGLEDPRIGTDEHLLSQCHDIWPDSPGGEL